MKQNHKHSEVRVSVNNRSNYIPKLSREDQFASVNIPEETHITANIALNLKTEQGSEKFPAGACTAASNILN